MSIRHDRLPETWNGFLAKWAQARAGVLTSPQESPQESAQSESSASTHDSDEVAEKGSGSLQGVLVAALVSCVLAFKYRVPKRGEMQIHHAQRFVFPATYPAVRIARVIPHLARRYKSTSLTLDVPAPLKGGARCHILRVWDSGIGGALNWIDVTLEDLLCPNNEN